MSGTGSLERIDVDIGLAAGDLLHLDAHLVVQGNKLLPGSLSLFGIDFLRQTGEQLHGLGVLRVHGRDDALILLGEIAVEICALLAFSAINNNDRVGLIIFSDRVEKFVPPRKGRQHVLRVLRELLYFEPEGRETDIGGVLQYLTRVVRRRAVVFLVSDFIGTGFSKALSVTGRRHDVIAVRMRDVRESELPPIGYVEFEDAESGEQLLVNTSDRAFRTAFEHHRAQSDAMLEGTFRTTKVDVIDIRTGEPYVDPLIRFFRERARRFR